jgi:hypothetical protein
MFQNLTQEVGLSSGSPIGGQIQNAIMAGQGPSVACKSVQEGHAGGTRATDTSAGTEQDKGGSSHKVGPKLAIAKCAVLDADNTGERTTG